MSEALMREFIGAVVGSCIALLAYYTYLILRKY